MTTDDPNTMRAVVDLDLCVGVGMCCQLGEGGFVLNETGQSVFQPDGNWTAEALREASEACPMSAIRIIGDAGGFG